MIAKSKEDKLLLALLADKLKQSEDKMYIVNSAFLDAREQSIADDFLRNRTSRYFFWGGFAEAERRCVIFVPDYLDLQQLQEDFVAEENELDPLAVLRVTPKARHTALTHRDYLGSLLALGINRARIGDIIIRDNGSDIIIQRDMADYLRFNYSRAGRHEIDTEVISTTAIGSYEPPYKEFTANISSLRLDSVAAAAFGVSRGKCAEAVSARLLAVNGRQTVKQDYLIKQGDTLTWRGKGKTKLINIGGTTKKERIFVTIKRYI